MKMDERNKERKREQRDRNDQPTQDLDSLNTFRHLMLSKRRVILNEQKKRQPGTAHKI